MTEKIALVTDSTCDLPTERLQREGVVRVPLSVLFGDQEYLDGEELAPDDFYRLLASSPHHPTTSQPSPGKFMAVFESLKREGYTHVLCLTISRKLSGTAQSATMAAQMVPGLRIEVVDSRAVTWTLGLLAIHAKSLIDQGLAFDDILARIQAQIPKTNVFFSTDSLDALVRGGRIGRAQAFFGKCLGIRPVMAFPGEAGQIEAVAKTRSLEDTFETMLRLARSHVQTHGLLSGIVLLYAAQPTHNDALRTRLQADSIFGSRITVGQIGSVVGAHLGAQGWGFVLV